MAEKDVEFSIVAKDKSGPAVKGAAEGLDRLGDKANKAQRKVDELGDQTGQLAKKMAEARASALLLARQFDKTGDSKILKDFQKASAEAAKLGRVMKTLKPPVPEIKNPSGFLGSITKLGKDAGLIAGNAAIDSFGDVFKALPGEVKAGLLTALAAAGVVAAPAIAGLVEGAVLAGVGTGGIAAGLILGARDPRVAAAYSALGERVLQKLQASARPFTGELLAAAPELERAFDAEAPRIGRIFATLSADVRPLLTATIESIRELMPSIERASAAAGPVIRSLAAALPPLAGSIGHLLDAFSASSRGGAASLAVLIGGLEAFFELMAEGGRELAPAVNAFGALMELVGLAPAANNGLITMGQSLDRAAGSAAFAGLTYEQLSQSLQNTAQQADAMNAAFDRLFGEMMNLDQANLAVKQGILNVKEAIKENGKTLDDTSQKGLNNIAVIQQQVAYYEQQRQAAIAAGNGTAEAAATANAAYASNIASLRQLLVQLGLPLAAVDALIAKYAQIPRNITTTVTTVYRKIGSPGQSDEATGHSRNGAGADTSALLSGWAPARYADAQRAEMRDGTGGGSSVGGPAEVHSEVNVSVLLDGEAIQPRINRTVQAARKRDAWRARVGRR